MHFKLKNTFEKPSPQYQTHIILPFFLAQLKICVEHGWIILNDLSIPILFVECVCSIIYINILILA
jgi:hypothetical protein